MEKYRLYKIALSPIETVEGDWTVSDVIQPTDLSKAQDVLESIFEEAIKRENQNMTIGKVGETGDAPLPNRILRNENYVTLLRLNNPKDVTIWKQTGTDYEKIKEESLPYSLIVIDNRPGIGQLAIQCSSEAWTDPEIIKRYLVENLNRILKDMNSGLVIELRHKWLPSDFFEFVRQKRREDGVTVKKLNFVFTNPEFEAPIETAVNASGHLGKLMKMLSELGGAKAKLSIDAPKKKELIKRKLPVIKQMVSLVASNGYKLNVEFSDNTKYVCNDHLLADVDMPEKYIADFRDGVKHQLFEFELFHWLDEKRNETKEYKDDEEPIKFSGTRKNRKKVS